MDAQPIEKNCEEFKNKGKKKGKSCINMHFLQERKIHVKNLSYRVEIKSNIVILLINQGISGIFHKLTNEKKCAIISKLIRKNNVFCFRCRKE